MLLLAIGQLLAEPYCVIKSVVVNGKAITPDKMDKIVLSTYDSLKINYSIESDEKANLNSYYFRVTLSNSLDSSSKVTGVSSALYTSLNEGNYVFSVGAFDLKGAWLASNESFSFKVSNSESELIKELEQKEILLKEYEEKIEASGNPLKGGFDLLSILLGAFVGLVLGIPIALVFARIFSPKVKKSNRGVRNMNNEETITISKEEYNKLLTENSNLRAEIAALRGQIDAMQARAVEMKKRNKDLEESIASLSSSKNELESLQKQKDELFALIIHDIKNPAALIKSLVELLRSYDLSAVEQQEIINDIAETTTRIVALSHEVSKILALETSRLMLDIEPAQVSEIVTDVVRRNTIQSDTKGITMTSDIAENLPEAEIDIQKIEEVVDNLISNAIKFTQKGGKVHVRAFVENKNITVEVTDNGLGLSESDVRNAFQRGSRLSATPTAGESSTGLGLWIVKKLIDAHSGRVWVKSTLGKGSTFAFSLPLRHIEKSSETAE